MNKLGYALLEAGDVPSAVAVFKANAEEFPWSANAHDSLADGLVASGDYSGAQTAWCQAFHIDRDYDRFFDAATPSEIARCLER